MKVYVSDGIEDQVRRYEDAAIVSAGHGYRNPGEVRCIVENTGNGYIAWYPSHVHHAQDYYVCLDYSQARDLVLGLSEFKEELGFK